MRNYIILNNKSSNDINGLIIQELAPISKPQQRTQVETIDGRDGDIVTPLGYAAYNKKIKIGLYGDFDINEIIAYFATKGTAIFSNEPDKYYNYQILDQIDYERLIRFRVATVTMHVQPFKYSATEGTITVDSSDTVSDEGSDIALDGTAEAPFNTLRHKGNATQQTYSGKNICSKATVAGNTSIKFYFDKTNSTNIVLSAITNAATNRASVYLVVDSAEIARIGTFTGDANQRGFAILTLTQAQIDTIQAGTSSWLNLYAGAGGFSSVSEAQIELGSTATAYEPYVGGIPSPNPDYPQDISVLTGDSTITIDDGGENSQEYVIPFGDTYLAKIGDYADEPVKVDGTWYIRRKIGKVVADGTTSITVHGTVGGILGARLAVSEGAQPSGNSISPIICDHFQSVSFAKYFNNDRSYGEIATHNSTVVSNLYITAPNSSVSTAQQFSAWLASNSTVAYYVLAEPTDEAITDQDLIDALDELYDQAHSYKGHTHITATAEDGNAPAVLAVEVNQDNETTVNNAGNTTSRPIITIYGQGDIGLYINDVQVLDIALGDEQYITIDSVAMEAYKDTTENLKNRLVTGDYNKLALNAGDNKIYFTGNVTKYEISKYSRWL